MMDQSRNDKIISRTVNKISGFHQTGSTASFYNYIQHWVSPRGQNLSGVN